VDGNIETFPHVSSEAHIARACVRCARARSCVFVRIRTRTHVARAPYTPRSRSGMNETMISTHGA